MDAVIVETKRCGRCKADKPATAEHFASHCWAKNNLQGWCRDCMRVYSRERNAAKKAAKAAS